MSILDSFPDGQVASPRDAVRTSRILLGRDSRSAGCNGGRLSAGRRNTSRLEEPARSALFDAGNGESRDFPETAGRVTAVATAPNGDGSPSRCGESGKIRPIRLLRSVWSSMRQPAKAIARHDSRHNDAIYASRSRPTARLLATRRIRPLSPVECSRTRGAIRTLRATTLKDHSDAIYSVAFHPDGQLLASGSRRPGREGVGHRDRQAPLHPRRPDRLGLCVAWSAGQEALDRRWSGQERAACGQPIERR